MKTLKETIKNALKKSVEKQKNEWPATSYPIFFQPERPKKDVKGK